MEVDRAVQAADNAPVAQQVVHGEGAPGTRPGIPTNAVVPPQSVQATAASIAASAPLHSTATSTGTPIRVLISSASTGRCRTAGRPGCRGHRSWPPPRGLGGIDVHGQDAPGAAEPGRLQHVHPDATHPEDHHGVPGRPGPRCAPRRSRSTPRSRSGRPRWPGSPARAPVGSPAPSSSPPTKRCWRRHGQVVPASGTGVARPRRRRDIRGPGPPSRSGTSRRGRSIRRPPHHRERPR